MQNQYALVVVDHFTKYFQVYAMRHNTALDVAKRLIKFVSIFGLPDHILTDQGTHFQNELLDTLYDMFDIHKRRTSPYNPRGDGLSVNKIKTLKATVSSIINNIFSYVT